MARVAPERKKALFSCHYFIFKALQKGSNMELVDLTGKKFGRLVVIERAANKGTKTAWKCRCTCSKKTICVVRGADLKKGKTQSCGCIREEHPNRTTHGLWGSHTHYVWNNMKKRCYNPKCKQYKDYGGRGVEICERWRDSFEAFYEDVSKLPHFGEKGYTINRINNNGNYEPGNVEWADDITQANNKRNNRLISYNGEEKTIAKLAKEFSIPYRTLYFRIYRGWNIEKALNTPCKNK